VLKDLYNKLRPPPTCLLQPLVKLQNKCLRRITGAYKRAPIKTLEKDAAVAPLPTRRRQRGGAGGATNGGTSDNEGPETSKANTIEAPKN
jgi:hypothetical protein